MVLTGSPAAAMASEAAAIPTEAVSSSAAAEEVPGGASDKAVEAKKEASAAAAGTEDAGSSQAEKTQEAVSVSSDAGKAAADPAVQTGADAAQISKEQGAEDPSGNMAAPASEDGLANPAAADSASSDAAAESADEQKDAGEISDTAGELKEEAAQGPAEEKRTGKASAKAKAASESSESGDPKEKEEDEEKDAWDGKGTASDPYLLKKTADIVLLRDKVNAGETFEGKTFKMTANISLPSGWVPIGCLKNGASAAGNGRNIQPFSGIFDGGGRQITVPSGGLPLFGYLRGAQVRNLSVYGPKIAADGIVANYPADYGPTGINSGTVIIAVTFTNVTLKRGSSTLRSGFIGGLSEGSSASAYGQSSGNNPVIFNNCTVEAGVTIGYDHSQNYIGSFGGRLNGTLTGCVSSAAVYGKHYVGGLVGYKDTSMGELSVSGSQFHGSVTASDTYAGGIVGGGYYHPTAPNSRIVTIESCTVDGTVSGSSCVGGIFGGEKGLWQAWSNGTGAIRGNTFSGKVSGGSSVGGIIGYYLSLNKFTVIENNFYSSSCGADTGIGTVLYVDSSHYHDGSAKPAGWKNGVYGFDTSEDSISQIKNDLYKTSAYNYIARTNHNRTDDPLGADKEKLCSTDVPEEDKPVEVKLSVSGNYKKEYTAGDKLDLSGITFTVTWSDGSKTHPAASKVSAKGFDSSKTGEQTITFTYHGMTAFITVTVKPKSNKIHVTVTVYGHYSHDSDTDGKVHGLSMGGLSTWVSGSRVEADTRDTVWDVLQRVFAANGISALTKNGGGSVYISGLVRGGTSLSEFDNGVNSGWMYLLNGAQSQKGVSQQYLTDGDSIILFYTDDYTQESGTMGGGGKKQEDTSAAAKKVISLINAIGSPVTLADKEKIEAARKAYDALAYADKAKVTNYSKLTAAEKALEALEKKDAEKKATDADREAAEKVMALIRAFAGRTGMPDEEKVSAARKAYERLTELQKLLVDNYDDLLAAEARLAAEEKAADAKTIYEKTGDYLESLGNPLVGAIGGEWMVVGLLRSGRKLQDQDAWYEMAAEYVEQTADENERLHRAKSSENSRMILALTSIGADVTDVRGHNLLVGLTDMAYVTKQGINGPSWALIALDANQYDIPESTSEDPVTREKLIAYLLDHQLEDGGWALAGEVSDTDITGMVLQALAPYYEESREVKEAIDRALETVSRMQNSDGSFSANNGDGGAYATCESIAQLITALSALGIDCNQDERFIKDGNSALDALCRFYVEGEGFRHVADGGTDGMATEQAYYAMTAYFRMLEGETALYDMTDILGGTRKKLKSEKDEEEAAENEEELLEPADERMAGDDSLAANEDDFAVAAFAAGNEEKASPVPAILAAVLLAAAAFLLFLLYRRRKETAGEEADGQGDGTENSAP